MKVTKEAKEQFISLYSQGDSIKSIISKTGYCDKSIARVLHNNNIKIRIGPEYQKSKLYNSEYFNDIDSKDKAYFLGLLYADGNIYLKRRRMQISLSTEDDYILYKMAYSMGYKGNLYNDRNIATKLIIDDRVLSNSLIEKGCIPSKSFTLQFPSASQVPINLLNHFIRGFFDGDGSVGERKKSIYYISFTSNEKFLEQLSDYLYNSIKVKFSRFYKRYKEKEQSCGSIFLTKGEEMRRFFYYIYENCDDLFLKRKYDRLLYHIKNNTLWNL